MYTRVWWSLLSADSAFNVLYQNLLLHPTCGHKQKYTDTPSIIGRINKQCSRPRRLYKTFTEPVLAVRVEHTPSLDNSQARTPCQPHTVIYHFMWDKRGYDKTFQRTHLTLSGNGHGERLLFKGWSRVSNGGLHLYFSHSSLQGSTEKRCLHTISIFLSRTQVDSSGPNDHQHFCANSRRHVIDSR